MAITKIHAIKSTVGKAIKYITSPEKTDGTLLATGYNCEPLTAHLDFKMTELLAREVKGDFRKTGGSDNLAYHLIQSFAKFDKITPEKAHAIGQELAAEMFQGKYEYVVTTHTDKGHIHNHIIVNSVSFYDFTKLRTEPYKTAQKIREISDKLCEENGLHVIRYPVGRGKGRKEWQSFNDGTSWKAKIKVAIDKAAREAGDYQGFVSLMKQAGVEIKEGKHIAFRIEGQERFTRGKSIGPQYTREGILERITQLINHAPRTLKGKFPEIKAMPFPVDKRAAYILRKQQIAQTKELAEMLLLARKEKVLTMEDFDKRITELKEQCKLIRRDIKTLGVKNQQYNEVARLLVTYNKYLPLHQKYQGMLAGRQRFFSKHEGELVAFDHALKELEKLGVSPSVDMNKVLELVAQQSQRAVDLQDKLNRAEARLTGLEKSQKIFVDIVNSYSKGKGQEASTPDKNNREGEKERG